MARRSPTRPTAPTGNPPEPAATDPLARWGERLRVLALGMLAALLAARCYWPGEDAATGSGQVWVFAIIAVLGLAVVAAFTGGRLPLRWSWADTAVLVLVALVGWSCREGDDRRAAINVAWEWGGLGIAYLLLRQLPRDRAEAGALAGAMVLTATALAAYGLFQITVEDPELRAMYGRDPTAVLAAAGVADEPSSRLLFEQRLLASREPRSTQALTNSLAGVLVGPIVLSLGILAAAAARRPWPGRFALAALTFGVPLIVLLVVLILTKSRSAYVGLVAGLAVLAWAFRGRLGDRALGLGASVLAALMAILVVAGLATRQLDREILTEATRSLAFRQDYWASTWGIIQESSRNYWRGVGPGNFATPYLRFKRLQSSEEISDPHNLLLEVWTTSGLPAVVALAAALSLGAWTALRPSRPPRAKRAWRWTDPIWGGPDPPKQAPLIPAAPSLTPPPNLPRSPLDRRERPEDELRRGIYERRRAIGRDPGSSVDLPPIPPPDPIPVAVPPVDPSPEPAPTHVALGQTPASLHEPLDPADRPALWIWWWAGLGGWLAVVLLGRLNPVADDGLTRWMILGWAWLAAALLARPLFVRRAVPAEAAAAGALAVAVHLLAAGGISMPPVALGLWSLLALGQNLRTDRPCARPREVPDARWWCFGLAVGMAALIGTFLGAVLPHWRSRAAMDQARAILDQRRPDYDTARPLLVQAASRDPLATRPWLDLADLEYRDWINSQGTPPRNTWIKLATALDRAATRPRNPDALGVQKYRLLLLAQFRAHPRVAADPELCRIVDEDRLRAAGRAVAIYPSSPALYAELARASAGVGRFAAAVDQAKTALMYDAYTPHADKKLSPQVRQDLDRDLEDWRRKAEAAEFAAYRARADRQRAEAAARSNPTPASSPPGTGAGPPPPTP